MTDCSQLSTELVEAQQQKASLPQNILAYCHTLAGHDINLYKDCVQSQHELQMQVDLQIAELEYDITVCNALRGIWIIHSTNPVANGQQFIITTWDTQGLLTMTFAFNDGTPGQIDASTYADVSSPNPTGLFFSINDQYGYAADLDKSTPLPQFINGLIGGLEDVTTPSGVAEWTATKLLDVL